MLQSLRKFSNMTIDEKRFYTTVIMIYSCLFMSLIVLAYSCFKQPNKSWEYSALEIALVSLLISVAAVIDSSRDVRLDKKAERKVEIIESVLSGEIKGKLEGLYKGILQGKSIDDVQVVNTLTDHKNENRKDVIIIYH